jgi:hypothetical protein
MSMAVSEISTEQQVPVIMPLPLPRTCAIGIPRHQPVGLSAETDGCRSAVLKSVLPTAFTLEV